MGQAPAHRSPGAQAGEARRHAGWRRRLNGAGIFVISVAARLASPSVILSFFSASIVACSMALLCEIASASRSADVVYASAVFGEGVALVTGINLLFDYHIGAALIARNLIHYVINFVKARARQVPAWLGRSLPSAPFFSLSFTACRSSTARMHLCQVSESRQS